MATCCPRPWACSARRLGRLGRWLSRASPLGFGLASVAQNREQHCRARPAPSSFKTSTLAHARVGIARREPRRRSGRIIDEPHGPAKVIGAAVVVQSAGASLVSPAGRAAR
jgi:hypothetical protein